MLERGEHRRRGAAKRVKNSVADERKHLNETRCEFQREWRGVLLGGCACQAPELLKPFVEFVLWHHAQLALFICWLAVSTRLPLHEDEFDVVLDNGVGLVWFSEKFGT